MARVVPESKVRARRKRRARVLVVGLSALVLAVTGGLVYLSWRPYLRIQEVRIEGAQTVASSTLEKFIRARLAGTYFGLLPKDNVFIYPKSRIEGNLRESYPLFADVSAAAGGLTSLVIAFAERSPVALWCGASPDAPQSCLYLDESGAAYAQAPAFSGAPYARYYGELSEGALPRQFLSPEAWRSLFALVDAMGKVAGEAERVRIADGEVSAFFEDLTVRFVLSEDAAKIFERFSLALQSAPFSSHALSEFEYLDLRFGDRLYYKLK